MAASLRDLMGEIARKRRGKLKPRGRKWCTHCSRVHPRSLACDLYLGVRREDAQGNPIVPQPYWHH